MIFAKRIKGRLWLVLWDRRLLYVVCLALVLWLVWRALSSLARRDATWEQIRREGVLRVGMEAAYPPFESLDDAGRFIGLDVDLATALAERWGVKVQFSNVHFDGLYDALKVHKFDLIISALPYDATLTRDVLYSQSYFNAGQVLLARADDARIQSVADLSGRKVAVELGAEAHQVVKQLARDKGLAIEIVAEREADAVAALLRAGRVDALVCDRVTAHRYLAQASGLHIVGAPLTDDPLVMAARLDSPVLMQEINAALQAWRENGFLDELVQRWLQ